LKTSARILVAVAMCLLLVATSNVAFAGSPVVPEPTSIVVWAGLAGAGGMVYWWRNRRKS